MGKLRKFSLQCSPQKGIGKKLLFARENPHKQNIFSNGHKLQLLVLQYFGFLSIIHNFHRIL